MMSVSCVPDDEGGWQPLSCSLCVQVAGVLGRLLAERNTWPLFESSLFIEASEGELWVPAAHIHET